MICKTGCQRKSKTCNLQFDTSLVVCCRGGKARRIGSTSQEQRIRTHRAVRVAVAVVEHVRRRAVLRAEPRRAVACERLDARQVDADAAVLACLLLVPAGVEGEGAAGDAADGAGLGCGDAGVVVGVMPASVAVHVGAGF